MGPYFDRKKRVVDPKSGKRRIEMNSTSWEVHQLYGRLKQFGGKRSKAFHHGIFPSEKNYPPSHDKNGKWIDYSLVQYGGNLCDRGLRIEEQPAPTKDHLNNRASTKEAGAQRMCHVELTLCLCVYVCVRCHLSTTTRSRSPVLPPTENRGHQCGTNRYEAVGFAGSQPAAHLC